MKLQQPPMNIIVTGVGAIIGLGIIKSLRNSVYDVHIVGVDRDKNSIGQYFCDTFYVKPDCDESDSLYLKFWVDVYKHEAAELIIPGIEPDMYFLNDNSKFLNDSGLNIALNNNHLIQLTADKFKFYQELQSTDIPIIPTINATSWNDCLNELGDPPYLLKPRKGSGSQGIKILNVEEDLQSQKRELFENSIVQQIIGCKDKEYTVGCFACGNNLPMDMIIFRRYLSPMGNTQYAEVVKESVIEETTLDLITKFKPNGPTNFQFRLAKGVAYILEINPRISSSTSLRTLFGYNESEMCIDYYIKNRRPRKPTIVPGRSWRYFED